MQKFIFYLLLLDLFSVTLQISDRKEVTIPVSSPVQLECDDDLKVNNIEVTIRQSYTTCFGTIPECILPNDAIEIIKKTCTKQVSCDVDIRSFTNNQSCLQEYGYFNIRYACKTIIDYSCDFKSNLCGWSPVSDRYGFRWTRGRRQTPYVDHTSASRTGGYVYIITTRYGRIEGVVAKLESGRIVAMEHQCFSFWYFTTNSRDSVQVFQNNDQLLDLSDNKYLKNLWHHIKIPLKRKQYDSFKLEFKVTHGNPEDGSFGAIVIDDIIIVNNKCVSDILMCDFETNSCDSNNEYSNQYNAKWTKRNGNPSFLSSKGPNTDHSTASGSGYYMYLKGGSLKETTASFRIRNLNLILSGSSCLTFWYHMYIFGTNGERRLDITVNNKRVLTKSASRSNKWMKATIDLDIRTISNIEFIGIIRDNTRWYNIGIDDISLASGTCKVTGPIYYQETCVDLNDDVSKETYCPKSYLDFTNALISFDPEKKECSQDYEMTRKRLLRKCKHADDDSQRCSINLLPDISAKPACFQLHELRIRHTCEGNTIDKSKGEKSTTIIGDLVSLPTNLNGSIDSEKGLVGGLIVAGLLLICLVILIVVIVRRHINGRRSEEIVENEYRGNDYIGCQDIALSQAAGCSSHTQNIEVYGQSSSNNTNTQSNNVQRTCSNLGTHEEFQSPPYAVHQHEIFADNQTTNTCSDEHAMVDPIAETSFSSTIHSKTGTSDSFLLVEPTVTGLNRTELSTGNKFEKHVMNTEDKIGENKIDENKIDHEDQYALSE